MRDLTLQLCPATVEDVQKSTLSEWAWERTDSEMAWENSMLWDCIFMANLFTDLDAPVSINYFRSGPSPFSDHINCFFKINVTAQVTIKMFNINGNLVLEKSDIAVGGQDTQWTLDTTKLSSGVYFTYIYVGSEYREIKMAKS